MKTYCLRLHRGDDILLSIRNMANRNHIDAGVILSGVGCVSTATIRDASGINIRTLCENMEIVSLMGTVSRERCHIHIALSKEDLSTIGGHLLEGCIVNTTCELIIGEQEEYLYGVEQDAETGYDEIVFDGR